MPIISDNNVYKLYENNSENLYIKYVYIISIFTYIDSCQFVVTASGDYSLYLTNADILVDWKLIEQIVSCFYYNSLILL